MSAAEMVSEEAVLAALEAADQFDEAFDTRDASVGRMYARMRAALLAAQPHLFAKGYEQGLRDAHAIAEARAAHFKALGESSGLGLSQASNRASGARSIAAAILALIPKEHNNG